MNKLGLADIQGLDSISWWPLPLAAWLVLGIVALLILGLYLSHRHRQKNARRWQHQVRKSLGDMEESLSTENSAQTASRLAPLLKRIAIQRFSRSDCANLQGEAWLRWLSEKDPSHFDWFRKGHFLVEAPFAPAGTTFETETIRRGIHAARKWVR